MKKYILLLAILFGMILSSCNNDEVIIAITKGAGSEHYDTYPNWIKSLHPNAKCVDLYNISLKDAERILKKCDGLILSGGPDVHPDRYGRNYDTSRCSIDARRDTLEWLACDIAFERKIPVLAVCRGEQLLNVYYGGTLIVDIPEDMKSNIHQDRSNPNVEHKVNIVVNSRFRKIVGVTNGVVNSNHHQAVGILANVFKPSAFSDDDIVEAYEWRDTIDKSFLLAVQWHPERLDSTNNTNPLSYEIGKAFIRAILNND